MATAPIFLKRLSAVAIKVQTGRGVVATPTLAANALPLIGTPPNFKLDYLEKNDRDVVTGQLGNAGGQPGPAGKYGTFDITLEPKGLGVAPTSSTFPEIHPLMLISKHVATFVPSSATFGTATAPTTGAAWEYADFETSDDVATVYAWSDGKLFVLADCVATYKLGAVANKPAAATFTVTGRFVSQASAPTFATPVISGVVPPLWKGNRASYGTGLDSLDTTNSFIPFSFEVDEAIAVSAMPSGAANLDATSAANTSGIVGHFITDRRPALKLSMLQPPMSVYDPYAEADDPNVAPARRFTAQLGNQAAAGNRIVVQTGAVQATVPESGDRDGMSTYAIAGKITQNTETATSRSTLLRIG